jgi:hypothetical protein
MFAFATSEEIAAVDFEEPADCVQIFYWRKHPNLHGWMERLYTRRGGAEVFNCAPVRLEVADIDALEQAVRADALPVTEGFFFGRSDRDDRCLDEEFIHKARDALSKGKRIYYTSWW